MVEPITQDEWRGVYYIESVEQFVTIDVRTDTVLLRDAFNFQVKKAFYKNYFGKFVQNYNVTRVPEKIKEFICDGNYEKFKEELEDTNAHLLKNKVEQKKIEHEISELYDDVELYNKQTRELIKQQEPELAKKASKQKEEKLDRIIELSEEKDELQKEKQAIKIRQESIRQNIKEVESMSNKVAFNQD